MITRRFSLVIAFMLFVLIKCSLDSSSEKKNTVLNQIPEFNSENFSVESYSLVNDTFAMIIEHDRGSNFVKLKSEFFSNRLIAKLLVPEERIKASVIVVKLQNTLKGLKSSLSYSSSDIERVKMIYSENGFQRELQEFVLDSLEVDDLVCLENSLPHVITFKRQLEGKELSMVRKDDLNIVRLLYNFGDYLDGEISDPKYKQFLRGANFHCYYTDSIGYSGRILQFINVSGSKEAIYQETRSSPHPN